jgi:YidC/Oxa1 family membrane protein insertase
MDKKSIFGIVLIAAIFIVYSNFFAPKQEDVKTANTEITDTIQIEGNDSNNIIVSDNKVVIDSNVINGDSITKDSNVVDEAILSTSKLEAGAFAQARVERLSTESEESFLENDKIKVSFTNAGGQVSSVWLKEYQTYSEYERKNYSKDTIDNPLQLFDADSSRIDWVLPDFKNDITTSDLIFNKEQTSPTSIVYSITGEGKSLSFEYSLPMGSYQMDMKVLNNGFSAQEASQIQLNWTSSILKTEHSKSQQAIVSGIFIYDDEDKYDYFAEGRDGDEIIEDNELEWIAFKQGYFSTMLKNKSNFKKGVELTGVYTGDSSKYVANYTAETNPQIAAGQVNEFTWFFGPNDYELLKSYEDGSEDLINWGMGVFRWINKYAINPVFTLFNGNWGIGFGLAILLLTVLVKILLMPINYKMYTQSAKMKVIKPELEEFNKKWEGKDDKVGKQQAQMSLMRDLGVNQFAGCLPSLAQMPILIAVYRYFPALVDLRQEKFLWAEDLSSYDSILDFGFNIPMYGDHVSLFTLLMAITMFVNTKLTGGQMQQPQQEGMPNMKIIMYLMPVMMLFFFNSYSSGLSYYYFISTLISIVIMYFIKLVLIDEKKIRAKIDGNLANPDKKKKSGFQARLAEMQRIQQEQQKKQKGKKK